MKILALDSSGLVASVAVLEDDAVLGEYTVNYKKTHSQTLLPMLDVVAKMIDLDLSTIDAIAVASGPGSFTGLRIGSATAKGLGLALKKPIISVPTLQGLAYNVFHLDALVCPIMDARRSQVYTGVYAQNQDSFEVIKEQSAMDIHDLICELNKQEKAVLFLGDGVPVYKETIMQELKVTYHFAPAHLSRQRAAAIGVLGMQMFQKGIYEDATCHQPDYLRKSQAEREREEKLNG